jgi:hypothetical protein
MALVLTSECTVCIYFGYYFVDETYLAGSTVTGPTVLTTIPLIP